MIFHSNKVFNGLILLLVFLICTLGLVVIFGKPNNNLYSYKEFERKFDTFFNYQIISKVSLPLENDSVPILNRIYLMIFGHDNDAESISNVGNRNKNATMLWLIKNNEESFNIKIFILKNRIFLLRIIVNNSKYETIKKQIEELKQQLSDFKVTIEKIDKEPSAYFKDVINVYYPQIDASKDNVVEVYLQPPFYLGSRLNSIKQKNAVDLRREL